MSSGKIQVSSGGFHMRFRDTLGRVLSFTVWEIQLSEHSTKNSFRQLVNPWFVLFAFVCAHFVVDSELSRRTVAWATLFLAEFIETIKNISESLQRILLLWSRLVVSTLSEPYGRGMLASTIYLKRLKLEIGKAPRPECYMYRSWCLSTYRFVGHEMWCESSLADGASRFIRSVDDNSVFCWQCRNSRMKLGGTRGTT